MKLIINNKESEVIVIDNFSRSLNIPNDNTFYANVSNDSVDEMNSMNYLIQYVKTPITSYKVINNDEAVLDVENVVGKLTGFNQNYNNNYYNGSASFEFEV